MLPAYCCDSGLLIGPLVAEALSRITPLGDLVKRRQLLLLVVLAGCLVTIGLAITKDVTVFIALSYIVGIFSVTPQILLPLAADLAPASKRAFAMSIVLSGLLLGVLVSRVLGGLLAEYTSWRNVYYVRSSTSSSNA
jgi:predicted MFS family arabinose efflux permease